MFYGKRIQQLEERVDALEKRVHELAHKVYEQSADIDKLYELFANKVAKAQTQESKPKPKFRPKKNGKETPKSAE
jgi:uncharacterized coiled-coil protein SlyX